jgi:hypothetical protein
LKFEQTTLLTISALSLSLSLCLLFLTGPQLRSLGASARKHGCEQHFCCQLLQPTFRPCARPEVPPPNRLLVSKLPTSCRLCPALVSRQNLNLLGFLPSRFLFYRTQVFIVLLCAL